MGRIKKAATERHNATLSPFVRDFVKRATDVPLYQLPAELAAFPQQWPFPRGDLYHWIPLLDRFDHILELCNSAYGLSEGPQKDPFGTQVLRTGDTDGVESGTASPQVLDAAGYSEDGDGDLIAAILTFTRVLLEHCGNRSLYASSSHISSLLNTTSLSLLRLCLRLGLRLAQRYQVARYKNHNPNNQSMLLANHYNFNLENMQKMAQPFPKPIIAGPSSLQTPVKGKEKPPQSPLLNTNDLVTLAKDKLPSKTIEDLSSVSLSYYDVAAAINRSIPAQPALDTSPGSPTPTRKPSSLGPGRDRPVIGERSASANDVSSPSGKSRDLDAAASPAPKLFHLPPSKVASTPVWQLMREALPSVPPDMHFELLHRVRIAKAFATSKAGFQDLVEIRLLAIANLVYVYSESKFHEKIGAQDSEEPRPLHLAQQLCDLLQPPSRDQTGLTLQTETTVLATLEALSRSRGKVVEVIDALAITVNHGLLYYLLRKVIATLSADEHADAEQELKENEWREATFELTNSLLTSNAQARYGEKMVAAGIMTILVEALHLQTSRAERFHEKVLQFFDSFVHNIPTSFQTLANIKGLDMIAELTAFEVETSMRKSRSGHGMPANYKSKVVDYDIPFHQQSTLRQLFKNTVHMFEHNAGTHDRLLRNLIDTPKILGALRVVIENAQVYGSNVWSGALNIISSFIHNEPTSYQVIGEAGLSRSLLESVTGRRLPDELPALDQVTLEPQAPPSAADGDGAHPSVASILPVGEVMCDIPTAFGAICLNESGMHLFQVSGALKQFFDIFLSPPHVRAMEEESHTAATIGHSFDELSRHHPQLKDDIIDALSNMLSRLSELCQKFAKDRNVGTKLWQPLGSDIVVAGGLAALSDPVQRSETSGHEVFDDRSETEREQAPAIQYLSPCFKFLEGFLQNNTMCSMFCEVSGIEVLLDLVTSRSNPHDLASFQLFPKIAHVIRAMCELKPHLVLPSLLRRTQNTLHGVRDILDNHTSESSFTGFLDLKSATPRPENFTVDGTTIVKSLLNAQLLTNILGRCLTPPPFPLRHSNQGHHLFTTLNFTDVYIDLVDELSRLYAACIWENIILQNQIPEKTWEITAPKAFVVRKVDSSGTIESIAERAAESSDDETQPNQDLESSTGASRQEMFSLKNIRTLRYLLSQLPTAIEAFFHSLGQAIVTKRTEFAAKQHAALVADHLAETVIWGVDNRRTGATEEMENKYVSHVLGMMNRTLLRATYSMDSFGVKEALTLVLNKFYFAKGFERMNQYLERFIGLLPDEEPLSNDADPPHSQISKSEQVVRDSIHQILSFYNQVVRSKSITEAVQSNAIANRDRNASDYFQPGQFLVEIRHAVFPAVDTLWHSKKIERLDDRDIKYTIDILRLVLKGEGEERVVRRSENAFRPAPQPAPEFKLWNRDGLSRLQNMHFNTELCEEALYRCNNHTLNSEQYCKLRRKYENAPNFPIPESDNSPSTGNEQGVGAPAAPANEPHPGPSNGLPETTAQLNIGSNVTSDQDLGSDMEDEDDDLDNNDNDDDDDEDDDDDHDMGSLGRIPAGLRDSDLSAMLDPRARDILQPPNSGLLSGLDEPREPFVTLDDLNDKREEHRTDLIDRCLDVLSTHPTITFELTDLIQAAVARPEGKPVPKLDIGATLISSLMSLQGQEVGLDAAAKIKADTKIKAYAHLVALIVQDHDFFEASYDELGDYFESLVEWMLLEPEQKADDKPWMEMILLIIERMLAEDEQPPEIVWHPPSPEDPLKPSLSPEPPELYVTDEARNRLFDALIDILPKIGKNSSLALSVSRVLLILTRRRELALKFSNKHNIGRLFLMIKQLAGSVDEKLQSCIMLILRHLIEDENIIRETMRAEVRVTFDNHRASRAMDTTTYVRNLHHLVLRDSAIFVQVTQEMLEIPRFDGNSHRALTLALKKGLTNPGTSDGEKPSASSDDPSKGESSDLQKPAETKFTTAETTDGVVSFLLRELSNYRDVDDKPVPVPKDMQREVTAAESPSSDVEMSDAPASDTPAATTVSPEQKTAKPVFKPEEHTIYVYRCFILQCLAELLACYNRTKIEFINFSRKPESSILTPSKPRAGTLNYLLNNLLPVGTLEHRDDITHRKAVVTSNWATSVLVSLCTKTSERHPQSSGRSQASDFADYEPELTFVQKFVLEHALRAFKEAAASTETLDQRYSRLLALGELFNRMLTGKIDDPRAASLATAGNYESHQQMGKLMYEKNLISILTSSMAELDFNFPNAKRTIKYILSPLKQLTRLGVAISTTSSSSGPGTSNDEDEISSATSISEGDDDEDREQTPDLFRGSSLGMFESGGGQEDDESDDEEDEDDEMYDDGYGEEMEYDEEPLPEHGDVVSDDDELDGIGEIEGVPGDVEMEVDIMMQDEEESEDSDLSDDDDEDVEEESMDDADFAAQMEEITGDDDNASLADHDDGVDWEDEGAAYAEADGDGEGGSPHGGPLEHLTHVFGDDEGEDPDDPDGLMRMGVGAGGDVFFDDEMAPDEDDDDDEEDGEELDYDGDVAYEPEVEDEEDDDVNGGWAWDHPPPPAMLRAGNHIQHVHHHHHHHGHGFNEMLNLIGEPIRPPGFRSHRTPAGGRDEDGVNPLLQRDGITSTGHRHHEHSEMNFGSRLHGRRTISARGNDSFLQELVNAVGAPNGAAMTLATTSGGMPQIISSVPMPPMFATTGRQAMLDLDPSHHWRELAPMGRGWPDVLQGRSGDRNGSTDEAQAVEFRATRTWVRWQEESRLLFPGRYHDRAMRVINSLLRALVPFAMEAKRIRDKEENERKAAAAEEERKKAEADRRARELQEKEEREARERQEAEAEAVVIAAIRRREELYPGGTHPRVSRVAANNNMEGMEVEEQPDADHAESHDVGSEPAERITATIRGRELDITGLGIDREYIEALPEEMREEVIMAQFAEQRSHAVESGDPPSDFTREFLEALPQDIRQELLRSEEMDRRRRERDQNRRRQAQEGNAPAPQPEEMDTADFMAMLDPVLRQSILMDSDETVLASLPEGIQAEARALGERRLPRLQHAPRTFESLGDGLHAGNGQPAPTHDEPREASRQRRPVAQMVDKNGVATLLRLMFISLNHKSKTNLHSVLSDLCKNTQTRAEIISLLLSVLQDGTSDLNAVEKSFSQLSQRAKHTSGPKTPQPLKRSNTGLPTYQQNPELSPLNIVQQCLTTLNSLANDNPRVPSFFLNEHETVPSQKTKTPKKGKARDSRAAKFPLNALLALLDRKLITENTVVMETLASLLSHVTHPLTILLRRAKEAQDHDEAANTVAEGASDRSASDIRMPEAPASGSSEVLTALAAALDSSKTVAPTNSDAKKKHRDLTPPEVPEENIRLVVNILAARECPSKTFSDTLDIIKNLSAIPGTKEIFGKEFIRQADDLGQNLLIDLEDLATQINEAKTGTDLQGMALASFSSAGSKQRKLLRVLVALDHLFDPKRNPVPHTASPSNGGNEKKLKDDILATLYTNATFEKLWTSLSSCLAAIRRRGNMVNVATILLPLIESLMVVCRNSTFKENSSQPVAAPSSDATTLPSDARMESLFFTFTEEHRKILNELIRNNPRLMNGNLAILAKNSKVLEFDNKRNYFSRKLHDRRTEVRVAHPSLQLPVRRDFVFQDSFKHLNFRTGNEIKYGKLNVRFQGEEGVDAGGVSREWFATMARQIFNPNWALFNPVAADRTTFHPNPLSEINELHLAYFKFIGRIIGKALYEGRVLDCHFSRAVYRRILGKSVSLKDMESLDLEYYKSLVWILENDITDVTFETFSVDVDRFGATETVDLIPNGRNIPVSEENKHEYVRLVVDHRLIKSVQQQLDTFLAGFHDIIPAELVAIFNEQEIELLISGLPEIDVDDWKNNTDYHNYQPTSPQIQWFWRAVRSFDKEEKAKLLQFVTGTSKVPLNGFKELEGMNGFTKFNIHRDYSNKEKLPSSHTCFNQLDLPEYESYEHLRHQLNTAITAGSEYFGFA